MKGLALLFSEMFNIVRGPSDDWFDPVLLFDTRLFVDPFLMYKSSVGGFERGHDELIAYFQNLFELVAESAGGRRVEFLDAARELATFPEIAEVCLGYSEYGTSGHSAGRSYAPIIVEGIRKAINVGLTNPDHFEKIGILQPGFGPDRISDAALFILRTRFIEYTQAVCNRHGVATEPWSIRRCRFNYSQQQWIDETVELPRNPFANKPVLLVPAGFLRDLPTINFNDFYDYCLDEEGEALRRDFNIDVSKRVDKKRILDIAQRSKAILDRYTKHVEGKSAHSYDFVRDPKKLKTWYEAAARYCVDNPLPRGFRDEASFVDAVRELVESFKRFVEHNRGYQLLWNDRPVRPKGEKAVQTLFLALAWHYCKENNIDLSPETDIGRGPVDFKLASGAILKALIEAKLVKSKRFWQGLQSQLPAYLTAEDIKTGFYLGVAFSTQELVRSQELAQHVATAVATNPQKIRYVGVDATGQARSGSRAG